MTDHSDVAERRKMAPALPHALDDSEQAECQILAIASAKGGTGKTVVTASIAYLLLRSGKKVLLLDTDFSTRGLSIYILGNIIRSKDLEILTENCLLEYMRGEFPTEYLKPRIINRSGVDFHILFTNKRFLNDSEPEQLLTVDKDMAPLTYGKKLDGILNHFSPVYDYIVIDTRGGFDFTSAMPAAMVNSYITVIEPDAISLEQIRPFIRAINTANKTLTKDGARKNSNVTRGFIVNKAAFEPSNQAFLKRMSQSYQTNVFGIVPADVDCIKAYETKEIPLIACPQSDFSYWLSQAASRIVNGGEGWKNDDRIKFDNFLQSIRKEWAAKKWFDKIISTMPVYQIIPLVFLIVFHIFYKIEGSLTFFYLVYASAAIFIIWSMANSFFKVFQYVREKRRFLRHSIQYAGIGVFFILSFLLAFDLPFNVVPTIPKNVEFDGHQLTREINKLTDSSEQFVSDWRATALEVVANNEERLLTELEDQIASIELQPPFLQSSEALVRRVQRDAKQEINKSADEALGWVAAQRYKMLERNENVNLAIQSRTGSNAYVSSLPERAQDQEQLDFPSVLELLEKHMSRLLNEIRTN